jgi:uncharacterized protein
MLETSNARLLRIALVVFGFLALLLSGPTTARAEPYTSVILRPVSDFAQVADERSVAVIEDALRTHQANTKTQIAILTLKSIDEPIEDFTLRTATRWGGGERELDNGILVVFSIDQRRSRIEVGYGLESTVTDARAKAILDSLRPELVAGDYAAALAKVAKALIEATGGKADIVLPAERIIRRPAPRPAADFTTEPSVRSNNDGLVFLAVIGFVFLAIMFLIIMNPSGSSTLSSSGWSSSSGSSSSSSSSSSLFSSSRSSSSSSSFSSSSSSSSRSSSYSGGGGSFGGGGASSSW